MFGRSMFRTLLYFILDEFSRNYFASVEIIVVDYPNNPSLIPFECILICFTDLW